MVLFSGYQICDSKITNWTAINTVAELGLMDISIGVNGEEGVSDLKSQDLWVIDHYHWNTMSRG